MTTMATAASLQLLSGSYAVEALLASTGRLPLGNVSLALNSLFQALFLLGLLVMVNLFPSGSVLSARWRILLWMVFPLIGLAAAKSMVFANSDVGESFAPLISISPAAMTTLNVIGNALTVSFVLLTVLHVVIRLGRSRDIERAQLKWFVYTFVAAVLVLVVLPSFGDAVDFILWTVAPTAFLLSIPLAILKYRLYEIDRIISRTLGYALVVGLLGLVYALGAVWLPSRLTGDSPLFVAGSTLAVAALFNPLRRRILHWVDRRFYRSRYDVEKVVEQFSGRLRRLTDVDRLTSDWVGVVTETMQPSAIGVWVRRR